MFVHGLGGHAYRTWEEIVPDVFADGRWDVAVIDYASGLRRFWDNHAADGARRFSFRAESPETRLQRLVDALRHLLGSYELVHLVGHSLGGLLVRDALVTLLERDFGPDPTSSDLRIGAFFAIASPLAGTPLSLPVVRRLTADGARLRVGAPENDRNERAFLSRLDRRESSRPGACIPFYAATGGVDGFVPPSSTNSGVPEQQTRQFVAGHTAILHPPGEDIALTSWIMERMSLRRSNREQAIRLETHAEHQARRPAGTESDVIFARFLSQPSDVEWTQAYLDASEDVSARLAQVYDVRGGPTPRVDISFSIHDADEVLADSGGAAQAVTAALTTGAEPTPHVGVAPVGPAGAAAAEELKGLVERLQGQEIFFNGVTDADDLRVRIILWLEVALRTRRLRWNPADAGNGAMP